MIDIHHLRAVHFFQELDDDALAAIVQVAHIRRVVCDAFFFYQDEPATVFYVLIEGQGRLSQITLDGDQVILGFASPYEEVGIIAVVHDAVYPLSLQAVTDCVALGWDSVILLDLMEHYPILALRALRMVTGRLVQLQEQYRELATERAERRIARALLRLAQQVGQAAADVVHIGLPLSRQDLAQMTGTTLYTVSRTFSQWEKQGLIESGRERVTIGSLSRLQAIAEDLPPT